MQAGSRRIAERKRQCKREDSSDTNVASEAEPFYENHFFLANSMRFLVSMLKDPTWKYAELVDEDRSTVEEDFAEVIRLAVAEEANGSGLLSFSPEVMRKAALRNRDKREAVRMSSPELDGGSGGEKRERAAAMSAPVGQ